MRIPNEGNRTAVVGSTGSGKTHGALWVLSMQDLQSRPWIVYNFKREKLIDQIPFAKGIEINELPVESSNGAWRNGIYIVHPRPDQKEELEAQMWSIWESENIGVMIDEAYMVPRYSDAYTALLTQGRSKSIPMLNLSQRPAYLNPFMLDQSEYLMIFELRKSDDIKRMQSNMPTRVSKGIEKKLPKFNSYYYDADADKLSILSPVPPLKTIYGTFARKLQPVRRTV